MVPGVADALIRLPRWSRLPQRGDAAAKGFRLFREQPVGQAFGAQRFLQGTGSEVAGWLEEAINGDLPPAWPLAGFVRIAFTYAFFHLNQGSSYRAAISDTLLRGGDTDTNACIVGGLIGAYRGINKLLLSEATSKIIFPAMMCDPSLGQNLPDVYHASTVPLPPHCLVEALLLD